MPHDQFHMSCHVLLFLFVVFVCYKSWSYSYEGLLLTGPTLSSLFINTPGVTKAVQQTVLLLSNSG